MLYKSFLDLGVWPAWDAIKVDDTEVGIAEGLNAGSWAVGVAVSGNLFGMSEADAAALAPAEFERKRAEAAKKLRIAGAHYVIDSVADLMPVTEAIDLRLAGGERP
jgi:phosphonoacetaldehyde hydrolase